MTLVMILGVCRLQYLNLKSKRIMLEDEEKNARLSGVRSTGLRVRRDNDIPFGVRAIESGIEVDGIWISRPTTPINQASASVSALATHEQQGKDKEKEVEGHDLLDPGLTAASPHLTPNDYRPRQPSTLRKGVSGDSDVLGSMDTYAVTLEQEQHGTGHRSPQYSRPNRDYSPSTGSSSCNSRTPDCFGDSRTNSISGFSGEYSDVMSAPPRTFAPGPQSRTLI